MTRVPPDDTIQMLSSNAWCGEAASGALAPGSLEWGARRDLPRPSQSLAPTEVDLDDWTHPKVGWGIVLADRADVPAADKSVGADAPEPIRELLAARGNAPVLRWRPDLKGRPPASLRRRRQLVGAEPTRRKRFGGQRRAALSADHRVAGSGAVECPVPAADRSLHRPARSRPERARALCRGAAFRLARRAARRASAAAVVRRSRASRHYPADAQDNL